MLGNGHLHNLLGILEKRKRWLEVEVLKEKGAMNLPSTTTREDAYQAGRGQAADSRLREHALERPAPPCVFAALLARLARHHAGLVETGSGR